ncbi:glycine betaine ABC transporter substrate-binding protein [Rhodococcus coprophilus]|uniref:Amino acid ABC transporter substrate-binding protein n=1 Tax=Rhodococcus coprophilus TaxID=38310 RepID=A0A2X4U4Q5_9NOCA|nr:glycine betaine ABC transporter substrate-binding protein [Rhodococcus coprophilus]MBM7457647.1 glycine betaine/choline ABC-type transport system substrate-binding protein [Rhodococcus coprophilus]SQI30108.1 amino acid ABC transporter substrate-binding protein [Rhodococcus coprophilus]
MKIRMLGVAALMTAAGTLVGCSTGQVLATDTDSGVITVGSGQSPDSRVLAEIYAAVLRGTGASVDTRLGLDDGEELAALDDGSVDLVPEYMGGLLLRLQPGAEAIEPDEVFEELNRSLPQGLSVSDYAVAEQPGSGDAGEAGSEAAAANVVPLIRGGALTPRQVEALNVVAGELTTDELTEMGDAVSRGDVAPEHAANEWLSAR